MPGDAPATAPRTPSCLAPFASIGNMVPGSRVPIRDAALAAPLRGSQPSSQWIAFPSDLVQVDRHGPVSSPRSLWRCVNRPGSNAGFPTRRRGGRDARKCHGSLPDSRSRLFFCAFASPCETSVRSGCPVGVAPWREARSPGIPVPLAARSRLGWTRHPFPVACCPDPVSCRASPGLSRSSRCS